MYPNHTHILSSSPPRLLRTKGAALRCCLLGVTDEFSRAMWGMYVPQLNIEAVMSFMQLAMSENDEKTFHGVPRNFVVDKNQIFANQKFGRFTTQLGIRIIASQQTTRQKSIAEQSLTQLEKFSSQFYGSSLSEINRELAKAAFDLNQRTARTGSWNTITAEQLVVYKKVAEVSHG